MLFWLSIKRTILVTLLQKLETNIWRVVTSATYISCRYLT
jgi:hypothetical protein